MTNTLKFELDLTNVEEADDGNTTHYGGSYVLNGEEKRGWGDDRSDSFHGEIDEAIAKACATAWPDLEENLEDYDFLDQILDARDELWGKSGTILVTRDGDDLTVTTEEK